MALLLLGAFPLCCVIKTIPFYSGFVEVIDSEGEKVPFLQIEGERFLIKGDLRTEFENLDGAFVKVKGHISNRKKGGICKVYEYRILNMGDSGTPFVGILRTRGDKIYLYEANLKTELMLVNDDIEKLNELVGWKVWVSGILIGPNTIKVIFFGRLKPP